MWSRASRRIRRGRWSVGEGPVVVVNRGCGECERAWSCTSMIGSCPLIPALMLSFDSFTSKSLPFKFPGIGAVMSKSLMVCVHLYGSLPCSSSSRCLASLSLAARSDGVGEAGRSSAMVSAEVELSLGGVDRFLVASVALLMSEPCPVEARVFVE